MDPNPSPQTATGRDGASRSSRLGSRAVVIARDGEIRDGWARALEAAGMTVTRCDGPTGDCVLLRGGDRCPLLDEAGLALYDEAVLSNEFLAHLRNAGCRAMAVATRDRHRWDGEHEPAMSRVIATPGD